MFSLLDLACRYRGQSAPAVRIDRWQVSQGEHWALVGPSGAGKSTVLHVLAGLLRPASGTVRVAGQDLGALNGGALDRWRGRTVGLVPQRLHLLSSLSVLRNVLVAPLLAGLTAERGRAVELLGALGLAGKLARRPGELSQGEAQRVAIARAVVNRPLLLLADEPTANLDDASARAALELLTAQARAVGATLLIATHDRRVRDALPHTREIAG